MQIKYTQTHDIRELGRGRLIRDSKIHWYTKGHRNIKLNPLRMKREANSCTPITVPLPIRICNESTSKLIRPKADHEQDWQPYKIDPSLAICNDHTYIQTYQVPITFIVGLVDESRTKNCP